MFVYNTVPLFTGVKIEYYYYNNMIASVSFVSTGTFTDVFPAITGMRDI